MQSGNAKTQHWVLEYEPASPRETEPLMGWTSSRDMRQQIVLHFDSKEDAIAYAERHGIPYQVSEAQDVSVKKISYADNFRYGRPQPWTH